jgi:NAD+ kinase
MKYKTIGIVADNTPSAQKAKLQLSKKYKLKQVQNRPNNKGIDALIALGGDGFMLQTLHNHIEDGVPVYGMNMGTVGFLLNNYSEKNLLERLEKARDTKIHPLKMICYSEDGSIIKASAINEVSLLRTSGQAAKLKITVDGTTHLDELVCDGVLVSTPAGSSAYNYSNGGMILPIYSNLLALTPICPFRPRRWKGAFLPNTAKVEFEVLRYWKRPAKAVADNFEVDNVIKVEIFEDTKKTIHLLFDAGHSLEERIMKEQFMVC